MLFIQIIVPYNVKGIDRFNYGIVEAGGDLPQLFLIGLAYMGFISKCDHFANHNRRAIGEDFTINNRIPPLRPYDNY